MQTIKVNEASEIPNDFTGIVEWADATKHWYLNGELHREDGPAIEFADGSKRWFLNNQKYPEREWKIEVEKLRAEREKEKEQVPAMNTIKVESAFDIPNNFTGIVEYANGDKRWFLNGERHRENGPAIENADGTKRWFLNGKYHCENGPAVERIDGTKKWYLNGSLHRENGPAVEYANGSKHWFLNDKRHRENGPAIEWGNGSKEWYLNNQKYSEKEWKIEVEKLKENRVNRAKEAPAMKVLQMQHNTKIPDDFTGIVEYRDGDKHWYLNGLRHRTDGPAIEFADGEKRWFLNGNLHREDGPAVEFADGEKRWFLNGNLHREDGAAIEWADETKSWYLNGEVYSEEQWKIEIGKLRENRQEKKTSPVNDTIRNSVESQEKQEKKTSYEDVENACKLMKSFCSDCNNSQVEIAINEMMKSCGHLDRDVVSLIVKKNILPSVKESIVTQKNTEINVLDEGKEAAKRVATSKLVKLSKALLLKFVLSKGKTKSEKNSLKKLVEDFLSTSEGEAAFGFFLGIILPHASKLGPLKNYEKVFETLSEEMRVAGMTDLGEMFLDKIGEFATSKEVIEFLSGISEETKVRAEDDTSNTKQIAQKETSFSIDLNGAIPENLVLKNLN